MKKMVEKLGTELQDEDRITFGFQGGEPTLAGLSYYQEFVKAVEDWGKKVHVTYALQTNGLLLDEKWCRFLKEKHFLVGISYDMLPKLQDGIRVDCYGKGTGKQVLEAIKLLEKHQVDYNVLCTLTRQAARHPDKIWREIERLDLKYIQFTPCLDDLEENGANAYALTPERFAAFYTELYDKWEASYRKGIYRSVKLIDDMVNLLAYGVPTGCGINGRCQPQLIVEADGSVYPCDFYCLDEYAIGNIVEISLQELFQRSIASEAKKRKGLPERCGSCPYLKVCGGNCPRMQKAICFSDEGKYCGYRTFWENCGERLARLALEQRRLNGRN